MKWVLLKSCLLQNILLVFMYMKIIHKIKYIIPQSAAELCELSDNLKSALKKFFNFGYYFFSHFRQVEIIQFNIIHFKHFQRKDGYFMRKVFSLSLNDEKDRDIIEFLDSFDKGYRTLYLKIAIRTYMKIFDSEMEEINNEMSELS